jgi:hypothetical protein
MDPAIRPVPGFAVAKLGSYSMPEIFFKDLPFKTAEEKIEKGDV